jgi:hypothetical protein
MHTPHRASWVTGIVLVAGMVCSQSPVSHAAPLPSVPGVGSSDSSGDSSGGQSSAPPSGGHGSKSGPHQSVIPHVRIPLGPMQISAQTVVITAPAAVPPRSVPPVLTPPPSQPIHIAAPQGPAVPIPVAPVAETPPPVVVAPPPVAVPPVAPAAPAPRITFTPVALTSAVGTDSAAMMVVLYVLIVGAWYFVRRIQAYVPAGEGRHHAEAR